MFKASFKVVCPGKTMVVTDKAGKMKTVRREFIQTVRYLDFDDEAAAIRHAKRILRGCFPSTRLMFRHVWRMQ